MKSEYQSILQSGIEKKYRMLEEEIMKDIVRRIRAGLPPGSRLCSVYEVFADCELSELAGSMELLNYGRRLLYLDRELAKEYIKEARRGDMG